MKKILTLIFLCSGLLLFSQPKIANINGPGMTVAINGAGESVLINDQIKPYGYDQSVFPFTVKIWRVGYVLGTNYYNDFDIAAFESSITGVTKYVDPVDGSDANSGDSWVAAKQTVAGAIAASANIVQLKSGWYNYNMSAASSVNRDIAFICEDGIAYLTTAMTGLSFSPDLTFTNTYVASYSGADASTVGIDLSNEDSEGRPIRLTVVSSAANCNSTANSIYYDAVNDLLYVRLFDSRAPDTDFKYLVQQSNLVSTSDDKLYGKNVYWLGGENTGGIARIHPNNIQTKEVVFNNCRFDYGTDAGVSARFNLRIYFFGGGAAYNTTDGFDYRDGSNGFEWYCKNNYNGYNGGNTNNGSTGHEENNIIRVGGNYEFNQGRTVHDIGTGTDCYLLGVTAGNSTTGTVAAKYAFAIGLLGGGQDCRMWAIECTANDIYGWEVADGTTLYLQNTNFTGKTNNIQGTVINL